MGIETATNIADLNTAWPLGTDPKSEGDNHLRVIKTAVKNQFGVGDIWFGQKASPDRWLWNDKADGTGGNVMTLNDTGKLSVSSHNAAWTMDLSGYTGGALAGLTGGTTSGSLIEGGPGGHMVVGLRDNDANDSFTIVSGNGNWGTDTTYDKVVAQFKADGTTAINGSVTLLGSLTTTGSSIISGTGTFIGTSTLWQAGPTSAGTINLRPQGWNSATSQTTIDSSGNMTVGGTISNISFGLTTGGTWSATGATSGFYVEQGTAILRTSRNSGTATNHWLLYNTNGNVGSVQTNASATVYNTSSDARLKENVHDYDPDQAIAIIRADPVQQFNWISSGAEAVGWIAQKSYQVSKDLASPPAEDNAEARPGDEDFQPWGIDQGKRTPYLWAALSRALDRIDELEARIDELELRLGDPVP